MRLFFKKIQKFGLFLSRFYAFFRVFEAKNTVPKEDGQTFCCSCDLCSCIRYTLHAVRCLIYFLCGWEILKVFLPACFAA